MTKKSTIAGLEALLNSEDSRQVFINPDGTVTERRPGHSRLVYNKATRTIDTVDPHPETNDKDQIALDAAYQIEALPTDLHEAQRTARIQLIVLAAMGSALSNGERRDA